MNFQERALTALERALALVQEDRVRDLGLLTERAARIDDLERTEIGLRAENEALRHDLATMVAENAAMKHEAGDLWDHLIEANQTIHHMLSGDLAAASRTTGSR